MNITEVAESAGVSVATVSRVLNQNPNVKPELRRRVLQVMAELGYRPSGIAGSMRSQSVPVIGLVITDIQNPFFTSLVRGVEDVANESRHGVLLCNSDEDAQKESLYVDVLLKLRVAGAILVPTSEACCGPIVEQGIPLVMADRHVPGLMADCVVLDNQLGAYQATDYLIGLGHQRIGLVSAPLGVSVGLERRRGYDQALTEHGIPSDEVLIETGDFKESGGYQACMRLLSLNPRPTAIFAVNSLMTMGALRAIRECGLHIPDDISVVGFDDMPWLPLLTPPLTAVCQPTYEIGAQAARLLFRRIQKGRALPVETVVLPPALIVRESTAPPAGAAQA